MIPEEQFTKVIRILMDVTDQKNKEILELQTDIVELKNTIDRLNDIIESNEAYNQ